MEWIVYLIIAVVILSIIGNYTSGPSRQNVAAKDYIEPKTKHTPLMAKDIIDTYAQDLGFRKELAAGECFIGIINEVTKHYEHDIKIIDEEITGTSVHYVKQMSNEEDEDIIEFIKKELASKIKKYEKQKMWYQKEINKLNEDCSPLMRKAMSFMKREEHIANSMLDFDLPKELPDSYL